jgi:paraquat-inducible protein A
MKPLDSIVACETCGLVQRLGELGPGLAAECARCASRLARHRPNSLGCRSLFEHGEILVAVVVFLASMVIPFVKLVGLFFLAATAASGSVRRRPARTWIYRAIDVVGPWAMLDVFLLAVLVALVKLGELATVLPGPGLLAFTAMVVLTILASSSFDPRLIWDRPARP